MTGTRVASLGMYDAPAVQAANDALWKAIAQRLRARGFDRLPEDLDRARPLEAIWEDPDLLLAHTCGYPLVARYAGRLRYVATPRYRVAGCTGARYRSRIVVRVEDPAERLSDLRHQRGAVNDWQSNSGMNLFRAALAPLAARRPFFDAVIVTGGHVASVRAVAEGAADVAAIDVVTFAHLQRADPALAHRVRTIAWTAAAPGLPLVTSLRTPDAEVAALVETLAEIAVDPMLAETRATLLLDGFEQVAPVHYDALLKLERAAARAGYPVLA